MNKTSNISPNYMLILPARVIKVLFFRQEGIATRNERKKGWYLLLPDKEDKTITISK